MRAKSTVTHIMRDRISYALDDTLTNRTNSRVENTVYTECAVPLNINVYDAVYSQFYQWVRKNLYSGRLG